MRVGSRARVRAKSPFEDVVCWSYTYQRRQSAQDGAESEIRAKRE